MILLKESIGSLIGSACVSTLSTRTLSTHGKEIIGSHIDKITFTLCSFVMLKVICLAIVP